MGMFLSNSDCSIVLNKQMSESSTALEILANYVSIKLSSCFHCRGRRAHERARVGVNVPRESVTSVSLNHKRLFLQREGEEKAFQ